MEKKKKKEKRERKEERKRGKEKGKERKKNQSNGGRKQKNVDDKKLSLRNPEVAGCRPEMMETGLPRLSNGGSPNDVVYRRLFNKGLSRNREVWR